MSSTHATKPQFGVAQRLAAPKLSRAAAAAFLVMSTASLARAQAPSKDDALAETLFAEGKKRMATGDYVGACPKLAESYRLSPGGGTLTALALCHEHTGKTATAWAEFIEVLTAAQQAGRADREKYAHQHIAALEPALSRLTVAVSSEAAHVADLTIRRDDVVVGSPAWGVASPVDPGEHVVEASAPGKMTWSTRVMVSGAADSKTVTVPALDDVTPTPEPAAVKAPAAETAAAVATAPALDNPPPERRGSSQRTAGYVLGAVGLASIGVGTYFGLEALTKSNDAKRACSPASCTDPNAVQTNNDAKTDAVVTDVLMAGGLATVIVGTIVVLAAPNDAEPPSTAPEPKAAAFRVLRVVPTVARRGGGLMLQAAW